MGPNDKPWHALPAGDAARAWGTDVERGLTTEAVHRQREQYGLNALPSPPRPSVVRQILAQFANGLVGTLLAAAAIAVGVAIWGHRGGDHGLARFSDAIAILTIVVVNAFIGFYQERKAEKALDALMKLSAARCQVRRNGEIHHIDARQLVPGDLVLLEAGDRVPADLRLVTATELQTVEGELTGESTAVDKLAEAVVPEGAAVGDQVTMVFAGTTVVNGEARGVVVATGRSTQVGRVGKLLEGVQKQQSPLTERLEDFGNRILWVCFGLSATLFVIGIVRGHVAWHELLLTAVSLAVAVIPEGLPAITSITLALGMQRMAARGAVVRKLAAVETLGCATVVCTDKTGTLTRNEMTVRVIEAGGQVVEVTGEGYEARGELRVEGVRLDDPSEAVRRTVAIGTVANTAHVKQGGTGGPQVSGDPTEAALVTLGTKIGLERHSELEASEHLLTIPFNSSRKRMTVVTRALGSTAGYQVHTKGAVDVLLPLCTRVLTATGEMALDELGRAAITARAEALSARALRVLAMAQRASRDGVTDRETAERDLVFVGLVGMIDPPRPEAREAIAECHRAGIRVMMITGDHPVTAGAIARELGLWSPDAVELTGADLRTLSDDALAEVLPRVRVFARVDPEHKLRIVQALQDRNHEVVAMTGDGVNDAPAIKQAAIGVAMGRGGTDVAREAADMVLQDDNFATIVEAVREGRAIYRNIQKSIFFLLSSNAGLCIAVFLTGFMSPEKAPPLTALQILWINLVTNGLPALALGVDPPEEGQMREGPRKPGSPLLSRQDWIAMGLVGTLMAACAMVIYWLPLWTAGDDPQEVSRSKLTMVFTLLALSPLAHAFNCRSQRTSIFRLGWFSNRWLVGAVVVSAAIHAVSLLVPSLQPVFRTNQSWSPWELAFVAALSLLPIPVVEVAKVFLRAAAARDTASRETAPPATA